MSPRDTRVTVELVTVVLLPDFVVCDPYVALDPSLPPTRWRSTRTAFEKEPPTLFVRSRLGNTGTHPTMIPT